MTRLALVATLVLLLAGCGRYGPPRRPARAPAEPPVVTQPAAPPSAEQPSDEEEETSP